jgi:SAM-dependent methyltransferase
MKNENEIRDAVRERYGKIATSNTMVEAGCCTPKSNSQCCGSQVDFDLISLRLGYSSEDIKEVPDSSNLGLGCGNPQAIANLKDGETVVDLGSGAGFDAFLAARKVGQKGKVIGVDMTSAMISKARKNAESVALNNIEFRLGEIEHLPVADGTADVIISNCVINLSPEKQQVFNEAFRILKPGGRLAISDVVSLKELPDKIKEDMDHFSACVSGASSIHSLKKIIENAGFEHIKIEPKPESKDVICDWDSGDIFADYIISATIEAVKP